MKENILHKMLYIIDLHGKNASDFAFPSFDLALPCLATGSTRGRVELHARCVRSPKAGENAGKRGRKGWLDRIGSGLLAFARITGGSGMGTSRGVAAATALPIWEGCVGFLETIDGDASVLSVFVSVLSVFSGVFSRVPLRSTEVRRPAGTGTAGPIFAEGSSTRGRVEVHARRVRSPKKGEKWLENRGLTGNAAGKVFYAR